MARVCQRLIIAATLGSTVDGFVSPGGQQVFPLEEVSGGASIVEPQYQLAIENEPVQEQASSWNPLALGAVLGLFVAVVAGRAPAAMAADLENGESIFSGNCSSCHAGGNNTVAPDKKLKKEALKQYGKYEVAQIVAQVTKGNGAMPAFGERLAPEDIGDVAAYVRAQADKGW